MNEKITNEQAKKLYDELSDFDYRFLSKLADRMGVNKGTLALIRDKKCKSPATLAQFIITGTEMLNEYSNINEKALQIVNGQTNDDKHYGC